MTREDLIAEPWPDYELLDSGDNRKLERYGSIVLIRPETQAVWSAHTPKAWSRAAAEFRFDGGKGSWREKNLPESWPLAWQDTKFTVRLTGFKHTGIFPEQAANWTWLKTRIGELTKKRPDSRPKVLNLFGYTGIASVVAAQAGAFVTHLDASRQSNSWAKENAALSGLPEDSIRYILDDAFKFVEREKRRGAKYDGIILDPPAFGRGPKGEVWKIEEELSHLLRATRDILNDEPGSFFLLNGYAAGYAPLSFAQAVGGCFGNGLKGEYGELQIAESGSPRRVPSGIYVRFVR